MMAVVSGTVCILAGVARLGFVTELLSKPIRYGYMNGIALTVLVSQFPKLFGVSVDAEGPLRNVMGNRRRNTSGKTNWIAFAVGAGTLVMILLLKGSKRVPGILIAVVGATVVVGALGLAARAGVSVLGSLPQGLPAFAIPWITWSTPSPRDRRPRCGPRGCAPSGSGPTPEIVPPVPQPATKWVIRPAVWRQISGPVVL